MIGCYFCWTRNPREKQREQTYGKEKAWFCNGTAPHWGFFQSQNIVGKICGKGIGVKMITHKQQKPKCYKMIFFCHLGGQIQKSFRIQNLHFNKLCFYKLIIKALNQYSTLNCQCEGSINIQQIAVQFKQPLSNTWQQYNSSHIWLWMRINSEIRKKDFPVNQSALGN